MDTNSHETLPGSGDLLLTPAVPAPETPAPPSAADVADFAAFLAFKKAQAEAPPARRRGQDVDAATANYRARKRSL